MKIEHLKIATEISNNALRVYIAITSRVEGAEKHLANGIEWQRLPLWQIADITGLTLKKVRTSIKRLIEKDYIERQQYVRGREADITWWYALPEASGHATDPKELTHEDTTPEGNPTESSVTNPEPFNKPNVHRNIAPPADAEMCDSSDIVGILGCKDIYLFNNNIYTVGYNTLNNSLTCNSKKEKIKQKRKKKMEEQTEMRKIKKAEPRQYYELDENGNLPETVEIPTVLLEKPDFEDTWKEYVEYRMGKSPMTKHAAKMILNKLLKLKRQLYDPVRVIEESIIHDWVGVWPNNSCIDRKAQLMHMPL